MKLRKGGTWVLWYQSIGFGFILLLTWLNELTDLPHTLLGGQPHAGNLRFCILETIVVLVAWGILFLATRRLVAHLHYLNGLLRVCAWCRKVNYEGDWVQMEQYFARGFKVESTHGICPDCAKKVEEDTKRIHRLEVERKNATSTGTSVPEQEVSASLPAGDHPDIAPQHDRAAA